MRNSTNPLSQIQDLQQHTVQLLSKLTDIFLQFKYRNIAHQRISQQAHKNTVSYQGLTLAQHLQLGSVMIKWQLTADTHHDLTHLQHEVAVLHAIHQNQHAHKNSSPIAPQLLAYEQLRLSILNPSLCNNPQQLTLLVMPYYPSGSLARQLNNYSTTLNIQQKTRIILQTAYLIDQLHQQGWQHNDIKPSNILIKAVFEDSARQIDALVLTDFALAERIDNSLDYEITRNAAGTPAYLAPECWQGLGATWQSDIYAFGILMYEILMSKRPFAISPDSREPPREWAIAHCQTPIPLLASPYRDYQYMINKALAKHTHKRYQSMADVTRDLERLMTS